MRHFYCKCCLCLSFLLFISGCQPKVYLMPAPIGLETDSDFFLLSEDRTDENLLYTLYATNRIPFNKFNNSTGYSIFPTQKLEFGFLVYQVGDDGTTWEDLEKESLKRERSEELLLSQVYIKPTTVYDGDDDIYRTSERGEGFFDMIDQELERSFDKDITVYVHGANTNFYRATAMGASFFHFTGHNSVLLTFSWPSAESLFQYGIDVMHAKETIPAFGRLLEILATHTKARKINIIAYSAGAQVVAPGLAYLHDLYPADSTNDLKERLRIGEVYFAAPDTAFKAFVERYLKFSDIVDRTTVTLNLNDRVLFLAAMQNGVSSLGRPDGRELSEEALTTLREALKTVELDVIDAGGSEALNVGVSHDYWYNNPWVSNDLLLLLLFNASPEERGLVKRLDKFDGNLYYFPGDYADKIPALLEQQKEKLNMNASLERVENE